MEAGAKWSDFNLDSDLLEDDTLGSVEEIGHVYIEHGLDFPFHESCWRMLKRRVKPTRDFLKRLFEVCSSLPYSNNHSYLDWGHDYGGATQLPSLQVELRPTGGDGNEIIIRHRYPASMDSDPMGRSEPERLVKRASETRRDRSLGICNEKPQAHIVSTVSETRRYSPNCFTKIPAEVCFLVAEYLPTRGALNLRLVSRAFVSLINSNAFWASRFLWHEDRSWFFEALNDETGKPLSLDWKQLYHETKRRNLGPGLRNRRRIWNLFPTILNATAVEWSGPHEWSEDDPSHDLSQVVMGRTQRAFQGQFGVTNGGMCRVYRMNRVLVPPRVNRCVVSLVTLGDAIYVAGLTLMAQNGATLSLGHRSSDQAKVEFDGLYGFVLAMGDRGVQGIRFCGPNYTETNWVGDPRGCPWSRRLVFTNSVTRLEAGFDGCKLVSLAALAPDKTFEQEMKDNRLWYPSVPGPHMSLNPCSAILNRTISRHQPLVHVHFGGPGGVLLNHLRRIRAFHRHRLLRIEFHYGEGLDPVVKGIGHYNQTEQGIQVVDIPIDGPRGEMIDAVDVHYGVPLGHFVDERFWSCRDVDPGQLHTNRNRSAALYPEPIHLGRLVSRRVELQKKTVVTGLYAQPDPRAFMEGFLSFGVMSEPIGLFGTVPGNFPIMPNSLIR